MRKVIVLMFLALTSSSVNAQEYVKNGNGIKIIDTTVSEKSYSLNQILDTISRIKDVEQSQIGEIHKKSEEDQKTWKDLLMKSLDLGVINKEDLNNILHELKGEVKGVNWTSNDLIEAENK